MRLLVLDFDGVIADSAAEAFVVAMRTYRAVLDPDGRFGADAERDARLVAQFVELMPLGNRAEDYGVCLAAIARGVPLPDQEAYDAFHASVDPDALRAFHRRFYQERAAWADADPEGWLARMPVYPGIPPLLRRVARRVDLAIATAKDRRAVGKLLVHYGVADLFPEGRVLDKDTGVSKRAHLEHLARETGLAFPELTFVDDKLNHLEDVAALGVRCILAAWGYNGERERRGARERGIPVCSLAGFEGCLFG
jgi:phosphoglycolate phosphatase-like HAD superfamily hydrolase